MRRWVLAGWLLLGPGAVAQEPLAEEPPAAASAGAGGATDVELGEWAHLSDARQGPQAQRQLYYVLQQGQPVARVVHAEPLRLLR